MGGYDGISSADHVPSVLKTLFSGYGVGAAGVHYKSSCAAVCHFEDFGRDGDGGGFEGI